MGSLFSLLGRFCTALALFLELLLDPSFVGGTLLLSGNEGSFPFRLSLLLQIGSTSTGEIGLGGGLQLCLKRCSSRRRPSEGLLLQLGVLHLWQGQRSAHRDGSPARHP